MTTSSAQRGMILLEQRRYPEAEKYFREALGIDPHDTAALYHLAVCEANQNRNAAALATIGRALALDPENADFHSLRALILVDERRAKEALAASEEALRIDPDSDYALTARAAALLSRNEWKTAEAAARRALEINPDNGTAAQQLAHALRLQNRLQESAGQTAYMLAQDPESPDNHSTAGWLALQSGDRRKAEEHFLEALRLDPSSEAAKAGLKESFKARSPVYRAYLGYCFFMQRFTASMQWLIIIGVLFGVRLATQLLGPWAMPVIVLYFLFVLWVHVAMAVGNFQLLFDRFARHALDRAEKWEAALVGGGVLLGLPLFVAGFLLSNPIVLVAGVTLIGASFPLAYTFTNSVPTGRILFGAVAALVYLAGITTIIRLVGPEGTLAWTHQLTTFAFFGVIAVTWLCNIPALNRRR